ncbi:hypothetical protein C815_00540 [Firmicutes bacterium M10-2]|nr:hypothetical protein C815_00540 [Firmicutes bacterium M10-2]
MNYFTTSSMKNLFSNDKNLPAFEQAITKLFRSELEKSLNEILGYMVVPTESAEIWKELLKDLKQEVSNEFLTFA